MTQYVVLLLLWISFCGLHSMLAAPKLKRYVNRKSGGLPDRHRLLYNVFALLNLSLVIWYQYSFSSPFLFTPVLWVKILAGLFSLAGALLMIYCLYQYFPVLSGLKKVNTDKSFIISGPNQWVRHPLYLGTLVFIYGLFILFPSLSNLIAIAAITLYTVIGIEYEEKKLHLEFGEAYRNYAARVAKLIPRMY